MVTFWVDGPPGPIISSGPVIWAGMRPYYRRRLRCFDAVAVYLRNANGVRGKVVIRGDAHKLLERGKTYTFEHFADEA